MSSNSHYFSNLNSIKHEINMTILSKPKKTVNIPTPKNNYNNINVLNNNKNKMKRNCQTLSDVDNKKNYLSHDKLFKDFKSKILLTKSNNISKSKKININNDKKKVSPTNDNINKVNKMKKKYNFVNNISLNSHLFINELFNDANIKEGYLKNYKSPKNKANTTQATMKNFLIKKNKSNHIYKDSFSNNYNNNKILLTQSSRNNNLNDYSSYIKQRCNSFNDFNSNINNIFINLKYSNNKKKQPIGIFDRFHFENNSIMLSQQNKKKNTKKRNISHAFSSNRIHSITNSFGNKKSINETIDKAIINNMNLNLNITTESNNNSYSFKNRKKLNNNYCINLKNKLSNKCSKSNLNRKRPCNLFIKSQKSSTSSTSRNKRKKNHSTLIQNSNLTLNLLKKNKIIGALKEIFYILSNKNNQIDVFKINKNNFIIPDDIIKSVLYIIHNCELNKRIVTIKEFVLKGTLLFENLPFEDQITILNYNKDK